MQNKWSKCIGVNNWHLHQILEYERDLAHFIGFGESLVLKRLKLEPYAYRNHTRITII